MRQSKTAPGEDDVTDQELRASVERFALSWTAAAPSADTKRETGAPAGAATAGPSLPEAMQRLAAVASDFVTPGDLLRTQSLLHLGTLRLGSG